MTYFVSTKIFEAEIDNALDMAFYTNPELFTEGKCDWPKILPLATSFLPDEIKQKIPKRRLYAIFQYVHRKDDVR